MNNGLVDNTATAIAVDPNGNGMSDEDNATMYLPQHPGIELIKEASHEPLATAKVGDLIGYTLTITNAGDVPLTNITLVDELEGIIINTGALDGLTLNPGEATVVTAEYAITEVDLETGSVYNHAVVTAENTVPYNEANTWSGAQQVSDEEALVEGIVAVADDLILAQTGGKFLIICGGIFVGLITTAVIVTYGISRRKNILIK